MVLSSFSSFSFSFIFSSYFLTVIITIYIKSSLEIFTCSLHYRPQPTSPQCVSCFILKVCQTSSRYSTLWYTVEPHLTDTSVIMNNYPSPDCEGCPVLPQVSKVVQSRSRFPNIYNLSQCPRRKPSLLPIKRG